MGHIKARGIILCTVAIALGLLTACGQNGTAPREADDQKLGTAVPSAIRASNLPDSSLLRAFLDVNGARSPMTINGAAAETTVTNLSAGAHTVAIVFEYQSPNFGDVVLATATQMLTLQPGQNSLAFNEQNYQFPDDDGDGSSNLTEIKNNTDPGDPNDLLRRWDTEGRSISNASALAPALAVDPSGNGLALWTNGGVDTLFANRFEPGTGWSAAAVIALPNNIDPVNRYQVAMDVNGNGIAVWQQGSSIFAERFHPASGWGTRDRLDLESSVQPFGPRLAMNANGVAVAIWYERDEPGGAISSIWANRFDGTAWGGARSIDNSMENASFPKVAVDANGNALAIWHQNLNLWASRYIANTGWGASTQIERLEGFTDAATSRIAMDSNGNGMAVWVQVVNPRHMVSANRFDATTGRWGDAIPIESPSVGASPLAGVPNVAFDAAGNALAIWGQDSGGGFLDIWANRFDAVTTAWGSATLIEDMDTPAGLALDGALAVRANGEAWAVWTQSDSTLNNIYANRFDPLAQAWGTPVLVENNSVNANDARIALADDGRGLAVWDGVVSELPGGEDVTAIFSNRLE